MKTRLLAFSACLGCIPAISQITIDQNDMPSQGDSLIVSFAAGTGSVDHTLTGANYYWDFSSLTPIAQQMYRFEAPTAIPFNFL